ncbi:HEAT repeat protein [Providencia rettgeri DSM 1131]|uniref:hypothetical protein n=1 Tax=Providencia rettgeri TaxID=587 RepID=UPI000197CB8F|nr:HEAT repeat protein [Providencia rettgeri DSM 1131]QXA57384.1 hypothetical protein I6L79_18775 [Providencia rettgeri]
MVQQILSSLLHLANSADVETKAAALKALGTYYGNVGGQDTLIIEQLMKSAHHPNASVAIAALDALYAIALTMNKAQRREFHRRTQQFPWADYLHYRRALSRTRRMNRRALQQWQSATEKIRGVHL